MLSSSCLWKNYSSNSSGRTHFVPCMPLWIDRVTKYWVPQPTIWTPAQIISLPRNSVIGNPELDVLMHPLHLLEMHISDQYPEADIFLNKNVWKERASNQRLLNVMHAYAAWRYCWIFFLKSCVGIVMKVFAFFYLPHIPEGVPLL